MKIATSSTDITILKLTEVPGLDPIDLIIENFEPGKGRLTIRCYSRAWTCAWFAMSGQRIERFFVGCDADYIIGNITCGYAHLMRKADLKREEAYLTRIVLAVQAALREHFDIARRAA